MKNSRGAYKMMVKLIYLAEGLEDIFKKPKFKSSDYRSKRTFSYLKKSGYIKSIDEKKNKYSLTVLGKIKTLNELVKKRKPDGKTRVVIFDVPEKQRSKRNSFRYHLEKLGFNMKQQSVWVSKLPCEDLVEMVIKYHGLGRYTELIVGDMVRLR